MLYVLHLFNGNRNARITDTDSRLDNRKFLRATANIFFEFYEASHAPFASGLIARLSVWNDTSGAPAQRTFLLPIYCRVLRPVMLI